MPFRIPPLPNTLPPRPILLSQRSFNSPFCIAKNATMAYVASPTKDPSMTATTNRKEYPLSMRLPEADIAVIDRAAQLRGRSRTDFVREAAVRAAEELLLDRTLLRMSADGFDAFVQAISAPAAPVPEMVASLRRPPPWQKATAKP